MTDIMAAKAVPLAPYVKSAGTSSGTYGGPVAIARARGLARVAAARRRPSSKDPTSRRLRSSNSWISSSRLRMPLAGKKRGAAQAPDNSGDPINVRVSNLEIPVRWRHMHQPVQESRIGSVATRLLVTVQAANASSSLPRPQQIAEERAIAWFESLCCNFSDDFVYRRPSTEDAKTRITLDAVSLIISKTDETGWL